MLRAVGTTRWQVRSMITLESIVTSLMGAAIGITLGIVLAALLIPRRLPHPGLADRLAHDTGARGRSWA